MLAAARIKPLPFTRYDVSELDIALREFSHAHHVGKIVVTVPSALPGPPARGAPEAWAITGGLGALGLITAEWLAGQGACHIHLLGRSGRWITESSGELSLKTMRSMKTVCACALILWLWVNTKLCCI